MTLTRRIAVGLGAAVFTVGVGLMACATIDLAAEELCRENRNGFNNNWQIYKRSTTPRDLFIAGAITAAIGAGLFAGAKRE